MPVKKPSEPKPTKKPTSRRVFHGGKNNWESRVRQEKLEEVFTRAMIAAFGTLLGKYGNDTMNRIRATQESAKQAEAIVRLWDKMLHKEPWLKDTSNLKRDMESV